METLTIPKKSFPHYHNEGRSNQIKCKYYYNTMKKDFKNSLACRRRD